MRFLLIHAYRFETPVPNKALQPTASSGRSCLALSKPSFRSGARLSPVICTGATKGYIVGITCTETQSTNQCTIRRSCESFWTEA